MQEDMSLYLAGQCVLIKAEILSGGEMMFFLTQILINLKNIVKRGESLAHKIKSKSFVLKRISSCFRIFWHQKIKASMTLEASLVLPFFLFAVLNLISIIEIYRVQSNMSAALHYTAKQMAVYGYEYKEIAKGAADIADDLGLTYLYAANNVKKLLGNDYLEKSPIKNGFSGISWTESKIMQSEECIDLVAKYKVEAPALIIGFNDFDMYNRIRTRAWTGYDNSEAIKDKEGKEELVYITDDGVVYHKSRGCTYLKLTIAAVDIELLKKKRNADGSIYYSCESCGDKSGATVFVTNYGNRYHSTLSCSKLKRTIRAVPISEVDGRGPCSKCGH